MYRRMDFLSAPRKFGTYLVNGTSAETVMVGGDSYGLEFMSTSSSFNGIGEE